jgi:hypothetical protein
MPGPPRRVLSLWLPRFATDRLRRQRAPAAQTRPLATVRAVQGRLLTAAANRAAEAAGVVPGLPLADARAFLPALETVEADPAGEARDLAMLADWCGRYTPVTATDGEDGLWLDITGCAHLFGGERTLLDDLGDRLEGFRFATRAAIADTPGAAWAAARPATDEDRHRVVLPADRTRAALAMLISTSCRARRWPRASARRRCGVSTRLWAGASSRSRRAGRCRAIGSASPFPNRSAAPRTSSPRRAVCSMGYASASRSSVRARDGWNSRFFALTARSRAPPSAPAARCAIRTI